jgi:putative hemolysin
LRFECQCRLQKRRQEEEGKVPVCVTPDGEEGAFSTPIAGQP